MVVAVIVPLSYSKHSSDLSYQMYYVEPLINKPDEELANMLWQRTHAPLQPMSKQPGMRAEWMPGDWMQGYGMQANWMHNACMQGNGKRVNWMQLLLLRSLPAPLHLLLRGSMQVRATRVDATTCHDTGCNHMPRNWTPLLLLVAGCKYCT